MTNFKLSFKKKKDFKNIYTYNDRQAEEQKTKDDPATKQQENLV